jgi:hypothetical protein
MRRRVALAAFVVAALLVACGGDGSEADSPTPTGTAITVNGDEVPEAEVVDELKTIAANEKFARVLKREDDTVLVPRPGTIYENVSQAWITKRVDQLLAAQALRERGLTVTAEDRADAKKGMEQVFRGADVFAAFPRAFRERAIEREAKVAALGATFPETHEPTDAQLMELWNQGLSCRDDKLVAQIYVDTEAEANQIATQLAQGADFATLARERSTDDSAERGGVAMCVGSLRFQASRKAVQNAVLATPVGATTGPIDAGDGWAILRILPLTFENSRALLADDWLGKHPNPFFDYMAARRADAAVTTKDRFGVVVPVRDTYVIQPPVEPVRL